eukprot:m.67302 g.67302  ORF g.67302 m.67302 type:complete len:995 (+) comp8426_c0_seq1:214-3198(+)
MSSAGRNNLPKGWTQVKLNASNPRQEGTPDVIYVCDKLQIAQYAVPTATDSSLVHKGNAVAAPTQYTVEPQPPNIPKPWIQMVVVPPLSGVASIVFYNPRDNTTSARPPPRRRVSGPIVRTHTHTHTPSSSESEPLGARADSTVSRKTTVPPLRLDSQPSVTVPPMGMDTDTHAGASGADDTGTSAALPARNSGTSTWVGKAMRRSSSIGAAPTGADESGAAPARKPGTLTRVGKALRRSISKGVPPDSPRKADAGSLDTHTDSPNTSDPLDIESGDEESLYVAVTESSIKSSSDEMKAHPFVASAVNAVVVLAAAPSGSKDACAPEVRALMDQLVAAKVKVFEHAGRLTPQFSCLMPEVLEVCSNVVVACTEDIHARKCQAVTYLAHAKHIKKNVVLAQVDPTVDVAKGQFGLLVSEFKRYDTTQKGDLKKLIAHVVKQQKLHSKTLPKSVSATTMTVAPDQSPGMATLSETAMMLREQDMQRRDDLVDTIVLLYSWGRQGPDGVYKNREKVLELKQELRAKGFKVWIDIDHMKSFTEEAWAAEVVAAIVQCRLVICCVTNTFHVPFSPAHEAFLLAIDCKIPGESIFGIKLSETCDMRCGSFGMYMAQVKYYDFSMAWLDTLDGRAKFNEMYRDICRLKPAIPHLRQSDPDNEDEPDEAEDDLYGDLNHIDDGGKALPQVEAAHGAVMLSYGWGKRVNGEYPNQRKVLTLAQLLQNHGFKVWIDLDHMMGNMDIVMAGAIDKAAAVVAVASQEYTEGVNAQKEWLYANQRKEPMKNLLIVTVSSRPFNVDPLFGVSRRRSSSMSNKVKSLSRWIECGGPDAIIDVSEACGTVHENVLGPGFRQLCAALVAAGVKCKVRKIQTEPSLRELERHASKRGKSVRRPKRPAKQAERPMWFVGMQDREGIYEKMASSVSGDYLVRESKTHPGAYVLMVNVDMTIRERKIARDKGKFYMKIDGESVAFNSMEELIAAVPDAKNVATSTIAQLTVKYDD